MILWLSITRKNRSVKVVSLIILDLNLHAVISAVLSNNENCSAFSLIVLAESTGLVKGEQDSV